MSGAAGSGGSASSSGGAMSGGASLGGATTGGSGGGPGGAMSGGTTAAGGVSGGGTSAMAGANAAGDAGAAGSGAARECLAAPAVAQMKIGWNLGNSLDSVDATKSDSEVETAWGNPKITRELIQAVAKAGFGVVRIPVTWVGRFGAAPDYVIHPAFFARVEEVVHYVLDQGLYAIINLHHDGGEGISGQWLTLVNSAKQVDPALNAAVLAQLKKMWAQIAKRFEGYGEHLIFESMNEIKVGYDPPLPAYYDQVNALNAAFVDTVRATGGNNATRCLVVPGYNTNIEYTVAGFVLPQDTSPGRLILSAHYYDPWSYAGAGMTHTWGAGAPGADDWGQEDWVRSAVGKLKTTYIDEGVPVIWGEYGAVRQAGYETYNRYYMEYVTKAVHDAGIAPIFWDNGSLGSGEEAFGLFNRKTNAVAQPEILAAMMRAVTADYTLADVAKP